MNILSKMDKKKPLALLIIVLSIAVTIGQIAETRPSYFQEVLYQLGAIIDPVQYMVGLLIINFIFVILAIKKYEKVPNPFLNTLKWFFTILFINDFFSLLFKVFQRSNIISLKNGFTGIGKTYLAVASAKSVTELTTTSIALFVFIYGLARYSPLNLNENIVGKKLKNVLLYLIIIKWVVSLPLCFTGFLESRMLFGWSLVLSQVAQITTTALIYWIVKGYQQVYDGDFFKNLTRYYVVSLTLAFLTFTYSIGSFQLLQRYPAGEIGTLGSFGQFVYDISLFAQIALNYFMYQAVSNYYESSEDDEQLLNNNYRITSL